MSEARWLVVATMLAVGACHAPTSAPPSGMSRLTAADNLAASAPVATEGERLPHCPSVVTGATTVVSETPGGVELRITGSADAMPEIRRRAAYLASASGSAGAHRGNGGMNAQFGRCPVVMRNTRVEARDIPGGAIVTIRPLNALDLDWLRREVEARSAQVASPRKFGAGLMKSCPSAAPNAQTTVTSTPAGVEVRVVEGSPGGAREIRDRAKELSARIASGAPADERCPVSVPDATLSVSEAPGGVVIGIKPKRPEDTAALQNKVQERARFFEPPSTER